MKLQGIKRKPRNLSPKSLIILNSNLSVDDAGVDWMPAQLPNTQDEFIRRYPCITAHIIAESLGYATPTNAARIGLDGVYERDNCCEWIDACYNGNARKALQDSIHNRHHHRGYMAEYKLAKKIVDKYLEDGSEPLFASWF